MKRTFTSLFILLFSVASVFAADDFQDLSLDSLDSIDSLPTIPAAAPAGTPTAAPAKTPAAASLTGTPTAAPAGTQTATPAKTQTTAPTGTQTATPSRPQAAPLTGTQTAAPTGTQTTAPGSPRRMKFQSVSELPGGSSVPSSDALPDSFSAPVIPEFSSMPAADLTAMPAAERTTSSGVVKVNSIPRSVENGLIIPIYEVDVPAEEAGVLMKLYITDFQQIKADDLIVQIDDRQAKMAVNVAEAKKESAEIQMKNNVNVRYAMAARDVANAEVLQADEANHKVPNTVPVVEYNRLILSRTQATLQIEQAEQEIKVAGENYKVAKAELEAAQLDQTKFEVHSPHDGVVMELYRKEGEWLKPGDP
ncbi:MAG: biotin/lipoyl-binding protein, partial [Thermoguttaceae bacterium]|nr:biotin/lipoyl-binding protein [Thermoguttaceae bacterium]